MMADPKPPNPGDALTRLIALAQDSDSEQMLADVTHVTMCLRWSTRRIRLLQTELRERAERAEVFGDSPSKSEVHSPVPAIEYFSRIAKLADSDQLWRHVHALTDFMTWSANKISTLHSELAESEEQRTPEDGGEAL